VSSPRAAARYRLALAHRVTSFPPTTLQRLRARSAETVQRGLRRLGYELRAYEPGPTPHEDDLRRAKLLRSEEIDLVLDVGANAGQFAQRLRGAGYGGRIVSFEPLSEVFGELSRHAAGDATWEARRLALSDEDGEAEIHVAGNSWSSSLLEMGARHLQSAPESAYVGTETVRTARLDSVWEEVARGAAYPFLKLDVQGFEMHVLRGAERSLGRLRGLQAELPLASLYEGDRPWREVVDHLGEHGFALAGVEPGFEDPASGRMLQFDGVFLRS
jgi:FkbM family methyltransferase